MSVPPPIKLGLLSNRIAIAPVTYTVAALVPDETPHLSPGIITGTLCPGATTSGFSFGLFLGNIGGNSLPLLSPIDDPCHKLPFTSTPPTQITVLTVPGEATSPSSFSPSFPAAATTTMPAS